MNVICMIGRFTKTPELRTTPDGVNVTSFTIAVNRPNTKDKTDFINCVAWRGTAEFITKFFNKGDKIAVSGVLTSRKFQDKDGNNRVAFEVLIDRADFCESKAKGESATEPTQDEPTFEELSENDDLPF